MAALESALLAGDLLGRAHVVQRAKQQGVEIPPERFRELSADTLHDVPKLPPSEAIEFFRTKVPLPMRTVERLVRMARERGLAVGVELTRQVREAIEREIASALKSGRGLSWFRSNVREILSRAGLTPAAPHHLETIFRTNLTTAYNAGRVEQMEDPAVSEAFPYAQYDATIDGATTDFCRAHHGLIIRRDSPQFRKLTPPNHFN